MSTHLCIVLCAMTLSACTLADPHADVPVAPQTSQAVNPLTLYPETLRSFERGTTPEAVAAWWVQEHGIEVHVAEDTVQAWWQAWQQTGGTPPTITPVVFSPRDSPTPPPVVAPVVPKGKGGKPTPPTQERPAAIIKQGQTAAMIEPTLRGYYGGSSTQRWTWQPGKLYKIYVSPDKKTKISLPPGELLVSQIFLDPEAWDVDSYRVATETTPQDVIFLRPYPDKSAKNTELALLTETGHSYDIHLVVLPTGGMFAVTWQVPTLTTIEADAPPLRAH